MKCQSNVLQRETFSARISLTVTYVFRVLFPARRRCSGVTSRDYRLQNRKTKAPMMEHRKDAIRARSCAEYSGRREIPISTLLQSCFSDLRDWLTRTSSHVPTGKVSNDINHGHVGTSIFVVRARRNSDTSRRADRYPRDTRSSVRKTCFYVLSRERARLSNFTSPASAIFLFRAVILSF